MRSTIISALVAIGLLALTFIASLVMSWHWNQNFIVIAIFLFLLTVLSHQINLSSVSKQGRAVIIPYLTSTVLKLILSSIFLIVMVLSEPSNIAAMVIVFLVYYAAFSVLEIILVNKRNTD